MNQLDAMKKTLTMVEDIREKGRSWGIYNPYTGERSFIVNAGLDEVIDMLKAEIAKEESK